MQELMERVQRGSRFVEAMMTVVATLKQQHRNPLDYITAVCCQMDTFFHLGGI
jgi:hypothetical protein